MNFIDNEMQDIMNRIKILREEKGLSFQDFATLTGMSKSTLQRYETGAIKNLPLSKIGAIASALGVTPAYIMGWEENKPTDNAGGLDDENLKLFNELSPDKQKQALDFLKFLKGQ